VVMGLLTDIGDTSDDATVEDIMIIGPTTIRPSEPLEAITGRMARQNVDAVLVTDSEGVLLGLLARRDAQVALAATRS
jgi:CBS domain-containing protein